MIYVIPGVVILAFFMYALVATPKSDYERMLDDEAQMKYLEEYRKRKAKK